MFEYFHVVVEAGSILSLLIVEVISLTHLLVYLLTECIERPQQRFLVSPSLESEGVGEELRERHGWTRLELRQDVDSFGSRMTSEDSSSSSSSSSSSRIYMPGSGIAKRLYLQW